MSAEEFNRYLSFFKAEVRRRDGKPYPPHSLHNISCGLLRVLRENGVYNKNILGSKDGRFNGFQKTLNSRIKELKQFRYGIHKKQAQYLSDAQENELWQKGSFVMLSAQSMLNTLLL